MIVEQSSRLLFLYIFLVPIPLSGMAIVLSRGLGWIVKWFISYFIIRKKMLYFQINIWQTFVVPIIAASLEAGVIFLLKITLYPVLLANISSIFATIIILGLGLFVGVFFVWMPAYAFFGGWDESSLDILEKAITISGPSKGFVRLIWKVSTKISQFSPFFGKYPIDTTGVDDEIRELIIARKEMMAVICCRPKSGQIWT